MPDSPGISFCQLSGSDPLGEIVLPAIAMLRRVDAVVALTRTLLGQKEKCKYEHPCLLLGMSLVEFALEKMACDAIFCTN